MQDFLPQDFLFPVAKNPNRERKFYQLFIPMQCNFHSRGAFAPKEGN